MDLPDLIDPEKHSSAKILAKSWCVFKSKRLNFSHLWAIENFSFFLNSSGPVYLKEDNFFAQDDQFESDQNPSLFWSLELILRSEDNPETICLALRPHYTSSEKDKTDQIYKARFSFSILDQEDNKLFTKTDYKIRRLSSARLHMSYLTEFISIQKLTDQTKEYLIHDKLRIFCEIQALHDLDVISGPNQRMSMFQNSLDAHGFRHVDKDFERLLECKMLCDVTLVISDQFGEKEISAHKAILAARSPVFAAMFSHDMEEKNANRVQIIDIEASVVEELLRYIYTGQIRDLASCADHLLVASDKYGMAQLKSKCEEFLCSNLNVNCVLQALILADVCSAKHLKENAIEYISNHPIEVLKTESWKKLVDSKPDLVFDIFKRK